MDFYSDERTGGDPTKQMVVVVAAVSGLILVTILVLIVLHVKYEDTEGKFMLALMWGGVAGVASGILATVYSKELTSWAGKKAATTAFGTPSRLPSETGAYEPFQRFTRPSYSPPVAPYTPSVATTEPSTNIDSRGY